MLKRIRKKLAIDPARCASWPWAEFEGSVGEPLHFRERADEWIDSCAAVRADGRGDKDGGGNKPLQAIP